MKELKGRTAVVTGAASGIGRGIALALAAEGMRVAALDVDAEGASAVTKELGAGSFALRADVGSSESLAAAAEEVRARTGGAHVLVNNAGVMLPLRPMSEASEADWEFVLSVNVLGVVKGVAAFLPQLRAAAPEAHIVNTASMGGLAAVPMFPIGPYVTSKYACVGYSESLRGELAPLGIGVSVLCPGMVGSNLAASSAKARPARLGAQAAPAAPAAPDPALAEYFMKAEDVGPVVVRGIRANRLHLLTHLDARGQVERRFRGILADFDAEAREQARASRARSDDGGAA
jgi:NAD(P)-dependent dehydrogenase (short-subunit alcohol dehydrogenase family)